MNIREAKLEDAAAIALRLSQSWLTSIDDTLSNYIVFTLV